MRYIIADLEWNGTFRRQTGCYFNEIIEIGAVKLNDKLEVVDEFHKFISPKFSTRISGVVRNLTSLSYDDLRDGESFFDAAEAFRRWKGDNSVVMTWGSTDLYVLLENCRFFFGTDSIPFLRLYANLQKYVQARVSDTSGNHLGLSNAARQLNIPVDTSTLHHALGDAQLSADIFREVFGPGTLRPFIKSAKNKDFYDRMVFKSIIISNINNPLVDTDAINFSCIACHTDAVRETDWVFKSRGFKATFACPKCGVSFVGRAQYKITYDGVTVKRSAYESLDRPPVLIEKIGCKTNDRMDLLRAAAYARGHSAG